MADFEKYLPKEFLLEGTKFTNDPTDTQGATKFGLVIDDLIEYNLDVNHDGKIDWTDVRDLTDIDAAKVLKKVYWDFMKADTINNQSLGEFFTDGGLNMGRILIAKYIQASLGITADGMIGNKSVAAINAHPNPAELFQAVYNKRKQRYANIIAARPSQIKFKRGWDNRLNAIQFVP